MSEPFRGTKTPVKISLISRSVLIRRAVLADVPSIAYLEELVANEPHWKAKAFTDFLNRKETLNYVAITENRFLGFVLTEKLKGRLDIVYIAVHPDFQREGIGGRLILKAASKPLDGSRLTAMVHERNVAAQIFLRSLGFLAVNYYPKQRVDDGCDCIGFELRPSVPATQ